MKHSLHFLVLIIIQFITITSQAQYVNINVNFKNWLSIHGYSACINGNQLDTTCSKVVNDTLLNLNNTFLVDISGIRYFDNLKT